MPKSSFCTIAIPKDNDKGPLVMESVLSSIHGQKVSFEVWSRKDRIEFAFCSENQEFIRQLLETHYPGISIRVKQDVATTLKDKPVHIRHLTLESCSIFPIRRYAQAQDWLNRSRIDPYLAILSTLRKTTDTEIRAIQIIFRKAPSTWSKRGADTLGIYNSISTWWGFSRCWRVLNWFTRVMYRCWLLRIIFLLLTRENGGKKMYFDSEIIDHRGHDRESASDAARAKLAQTAFEVAIRLIVAGEECDEQKALGELATAFRQFNLPEFNSFRERSFRNRSAFKAVHERKLVSSMILCVEELAGIVAFPGKEVQVPELKRTTFKALRQKEAIAKGIVIGQTLRGNQSVHLSKSDYQRHMAILGKTGSGKSTCIRNMFQNLLQNGQGVCLFDPHGDLFDAACESIPRKRIEDVVLIDPADMSYPVSFNPLKSSHCSESQVVSSVVDAFKKLFAASWGPRTEYFLSQAMATLVAQKNATLLGIGKLFFHEQYRKECLKHIADPVLIEFWQREYKSMPTRLRIESIAPILNKVNRFLMVPMIRNILGQQENSIDFREIMDSRKILLVNLSKGILGEENSSLLGNFLLAHLQLAALSRADVPRSSRRPFYVFIDELQNLINSTDGHIATLLNEGRKYQVRLILATQHTSQLGSLAENIFGNVNALVAYNLGHIDARLIRPYLGEVCEDDLINLPPYHGYLRTVRKGTAQVFSFKNVLPDCQPNPADRESLILYCRRQYARPQAEVEAEMRRFFQENSPLP